MSGSSGWGRGVGDRFKVAAAALLSAFLLLVSFGVQAGDDASRALPSDVLGERGPAFIERGITARAEVERVLGAPAVSAPDGRWIFHESSFTRDESGAWAPVWF